MNPLRFLKLFVPDSVYNIEKKQQTISGAPLLYFWLGTKMSLLFYLMMMMRWFLGWHREVVFRLSLSAHLMERREIWDPPELNHIASVFLAIYCRFPLHILLLGPYNKSVHHMQTKVPADPYLFTRLRSPFPIVACALYAWLLLQTRGICQIVIAVSSATTSALVNNAEEPYI